MATTAITHSPSPQASGLPNNLNMNASVVVLLALAALAAARPQGFQAQSQASQAQPQYRIVPTLHRNEVRDDHNQVSLAYTTGDGTAVTQQTYLKLVADGEFKGQYVPVTKGSFSFYDDKQQVHTRHYVSDEGGFQIVGDDLPVAPEAPVAPVA